MKTRALMCILSLVVIMGLADAACAVPYTPETLPEPDAELIVVCGMLPEFDPVRMAGLLPEPPISFAARNPEPSGEPVSRPDRQDAPPVPEPTTLVLVCLGLGLLVIRCVKPSLRT